MGVTIILPAHNEEKIIKQAIESLLNQSYWDTEIIVCLDNCTDKTEAILNDNFGDNYAVKIFKSVNNQKKKAGALNQLFRCYFNNMRKYRGRYHKNIAGLLDFFIFSASASIRLPHS